MLSNSDQGQIGLLQVKDSSFASPKPIGPRSGITWFTLFRTYFVRAFAHCGFLFNYLFIFWNHIHYIIYKPSIKGSKANAEQFSNWDFSGAGLGSSSTTSGGLPPPSESLRPVGGQLGRQSGNANSLQLDEIGVIGEKKSQFGLETFSSDIFKNG